MLCTDRFVICPQNYLFRRIDRQAPINKKSLLVRTSGSQRLVVFRFESKDSLPKHLFITHIFITHTCVSSAIRTKE